MGPRADFTCLSKKCQQDGAATVYTDLPINTTRCPVCGSKRITRLYNGVNVARGIAAGVDRAVAPIAEEHARIRESQRRSEALHPANGTGRKLANFMVPMNQVMAGSELATKATPLDGMRPVYVDDAGRGMRPPPMKTRYHAIDRESRP